jgi:hypothetical protein
VAKLDGIDDNVFGHSSRTAFNHHDAVFGADDSDVDRAFATIGVGRVDDKFAVHLTDAHRAYRCAKWNIGERKRCTGGVDADDVRIVFLVRGEDQRDDLRLVAEAFRKERADGAVDLAAGKNFTLARTAFALDESAGDATAGIGVLALIDGEWEEINSFLWIGGGDCGREHHAVTLRDQGCAGSLLGHAASLKSQPLATGKLDCNFMLHIFLVS